MLVDKEDKLETDNIYRVKTNSTLVRSLTLQMLGAAMRWNFSVGYDHEERASSTGFNRQILAESNATKCHGQSL
jgi:hypothetical protein